MTWRVVYRSTDQTIEQRVVGDGDGAVVEERITWHTNTPEQRIGELEAALTAISTRLASGAIK